MVALQSIMPSSLRIQFQTMSLRLTQLKGQVLNQSEQAILCQDRNKRIGELRSLDRFKKGSLKSYMPHVLDHTNVYYIVKHQKVFPHTIECYYILQIMKRLTIQNKTAGVKEKANKRRVKMDRRSRKPVRVIFNMGLNVSYSPHFMCTPVHYVCVTKLPIKCSSSSCLAFVTFSSIVTYMPRKYIKMDRWSSKMELGYKLTNQ